MIDPVKVKVGLKILDYLKALIGWESSDKAKWGIILKAIVLILEKENKIMATLQELKEKAQLQITKIEALNTALDGMRGAFEAVKSELETLKNAGLTPTQQAQVDDIANDLSVAVAKVEETYAENFPEVPPPPPPEGNEV